MVKFSQKTLGIESARSQISTYRWNNEEIHIKLGNMYVHKIIVYINEDLTYRIWMKW